MHRALRPETSAQGTEQRLRVPLHLPRWSGEKPRGMLLGSSRGAEKDRDWRRDCSTLGES